MKFKALKKTIIVAALTMMLGTSTTVMAADYTVTPVQTIFATKANTVVYLTADLATPTQCILPEDFQVTVTGVTSTGFWEIDINGTKFYITGDAVKMDAVVAQPATQAQTPAVITTGMKNAVGKAKSYIGFMGFSRKGLIEQLAYEGFTDAECVYGADNCGADWNAECVEKAQSYMSFMSFSRQGLTEQLAYEGFTDAQIAYGLAAVGY